MNIFGDGVAPKGAPSPAQCLSCEKFYPKDWQRFDIKFRINIPCGCGARTSTRLSTIHISHDSAHLLDPETTKAQVWYHVTTKDNWHGVLLNSDRNPTTPFVHVGTLQAAVERMEYFVAHNWDEDAYYLYAVTLNEDVQLAPSIYADEDEWPSYVGEFPEDLRDYSAFRYVNKFESPGSISLLMNPRNFTVQSKRKFSWEEAGEFADDTLGKLVRKKSASVLSPVLAPPVILDPSPL